MEKEDQSLEKALSQNEFVYRYLMAIDHALLWVAALSFAAYFHLSGSYSHDQALLFSTLVAYGAYLFESVLIILTAGWQKYMDGRIPPRLQATAKPLKLKIK